MIRKRYCMRERDEREREREGGEAGGLGKFGIFKSFNTFISTKIKKICAQWGIPPPPPSPDPYTWMLFPKLDSPWALTPRLLSSIIMCLDLATPLLIHLRKPRVFGPLHSPNNGSGVDRKPLGCEDAADSTI